MIKARQCAEGKFKAKYYFKGKKKEGEKKVFQFKKTLKYLDIF